MTARLPPPHVVGVNVTTRGSSHFPQAAMRCGKSLTSEYNCNYLAPFFFCEIKKWFSKEGKSPSCREISDNKTPNRKWENAPHRLNKSLCKCWTHGWSFGSWWPLILLQVVLEVLVNTGAQEGQNSATHLLSDICSGIGFSQSKVQEQNLTISHIVDLQEARSSGRMKHSWGVLNS